MMPTMTTWILRSWLHLRQLVASQSGQAMAEYSTFTFAILIGAGYAGFAMPFGPGNLTLVQQLYGALQVHVNSMWYSLSLGLP